MKIAPFSYGYGYKVLKKDGGVDRGLEFLWFNTEMYRLNQPIVTPT